MRELLLDISEPSYGYLYTASTRAGISNLLWCVLCANKRRVRVVLEYLELERILLILNSNKVCCVYCFETLLSRGVPTVWNGMDV